MIDSKTRDQLKRNWQCVKREVRDAAAKDGRDPNLITIIGVSKYVDAATTLALVEAGCTDLGESRPQSLWDKAESLSLDPNIRWHLIGHLQRNKARRVLPLVSLVHSVDTFRLLSTLDRLAEDLELQPRVLLEVNMSGESAKHGFSQQELVENWNDVLECRHLQIDGLMTMAALADDVEQTRPVFRGLRELRDRLVHLSSPSVPLAELSMGMSRDFETAIEEGATILRIGSSLFERLSRDD